MAADKLSYALAYANYGIAVFPCHHIEADRECSCGKLKCPSAGKHPILKGWQTEATLDEDAIRRMWEAHPDANIGVACGEGSGLTVLDVDGDLGRETLRNLELEHGELPETPIAITGSGGNHYYFHFEPSVSNAVRFAPGLDIRTQGGLVIGVGSKTRREYAWEAIAPISYDLQPAKMPDWLVGLITAKPNGNGRGVHVPTEPLHEGEGRNNLLFKLARSQHAQGFPSVAIDKSVRALNETFKPPLDRGEVTAIIANAIQTPDRPDFRQSSVDDVSPVYSSQVQTPKRELLVSEARDVAETANAEYLTRRPIIERLGYTESIALIVGGKHAGKTTNVRTLALSVARGLPIWGRATEQGHVTYVCSDDELASTRMELLHMGWKKSDPFVLAHAAPGMYPDPEEILAAISTAASQQNSVLIILDMLFDFAKIKDEMSYAGTREAIGKIQTLASSTKAFVLATHHSPKYPPDVGTAATAALGSQGIAARFSPIILAKRWADDLYTVESTMTRDPRGAALSATCVKVNDSGWVETLGEFKSWMKWRIYAPRVMGLFEQAEPGKTLIVQAVAAELDIPRPEAQNTLYRLFLEGALKREQRKRSMHYWLEKQEGLFERSERGESEDERF